MEMVNNRFSSMYVPCLVSALILNLLFVSNIYVEGRDLSWSKNAAVEAEAVAAISCSGHGRAYLDGLVEDDNSKPPCECNVCYTGADCSQIIPDCKVDGGSGDPLYLEPFWIKHAASSAVVISGWHRMSYYYKNDGYIVKELDRLLRKLHAHVGNAVTEDRYIVFGAGSTQVLNAAAYALSDANASTGVVASVPYYMGVQDQVEYFNTQRFQYLGDADAWRNVSDTSKPMIEVVTSPNNPDGGLTKPLLQGPNVKVITDRAYYWPHYTPIPAPADEDLMVFTLSKLTGHAGTRFGWAVVKNETVFNRMLDFIEVNTFGVSRDAQLRTFKLLKAALEGEGRELFDFAYQTMKTKWEILNKTLSSSNRFSLQKNDPQYCTFYKRVREFTPAYAWVKCEREEDKDCYAVLEAGNIIGRPGSRFGAEARYARLSLIRNQDDFDMLIERLKELL